MKRIDFFNRLIQATGLMGIYLFFSGWIYIYYYFDSFGVGLSSLNLPLHFIFAHSFNVLATPKIIIIIAPAVLYFIITSRDNLKFDKILMASDIILFLTIFPLLFAISRSIGIEAANNRKLKSDKVLPKIHFEFNAASYDTTAIFLGRTMEDRRSLRLLLHNNDTFYVFFPTEQTGQGGFRLYIVPKESLRSIFVVQMKGE